MATNSEPTVVAYLKPVCGWSAGVRAVLDKYSLAYEDKDIINNASSYYEMLPRAASRSLPVSW